jgi:hypothetical protein
LPTPLSSPIYLTLITVTSSATATATPILSTTQGFYTTSSSSTTPSSSPANTLPIDPKIIGLAVGLPAIVIIALITLLAYLRISTLSRQHEAQKAAAAAKHERDPDDDYTEKHKPELQAESCDFYPKELGGDRCFTEAAGTPLSEMNADKTWGRFELESPMTSMVSLSQISPVSPLTPC